MIMIMMMMIIMMMVTVVVMVIAMYAADGGVRFIKMAAIPLIIQVLYFYDWM